MGADGSKLKDIKVKETMDCFHKELFVFRHLVWQTAELI